MIANSPNKLIIPNKLPPVVELVFVFVLLFVFVEFPPSTSLLHLSQVRFTGFQL